MADILGKSDALNYDFSLNNLQNINPVSLGLGNNYNTPTLTKPKMVNIPTYSQTSQPTNKLSAKDEFWDLARNYEDNVIKDKEQLGYTYNPADNSWTAPIDVQRSFNESHWLNRAKQFGFNSIDEVKQWQSKQGLQVDGMFGPKSEQVWNQLNQQASQGGTNINTSNSGLNPRDPFAWAKSQGLKGYTANGRDYYYHPKFGRIFADGKVYNPNTKQLGKFNAGEVIWNNSGKNYKNKPYTSGQDYLDESRLRADFDRQFIENLKNSGIDLVTNVHGGVNGDWLRKQPGYKEAYQQFRKNNTVTTVFDHMGNSLAGFARWLNNGVTQPINVQKQSSKFNNGGKMNNQEEMQKAFMAFLIQDAAEQGMQIQSEQDLQAYAEQLGEDGLKAKYQEFMQKMQGQTPAAKYGAKLNYLKQLKGECPEGYEVTYFKEGGMFRKGCKVCEAKKAMMQKGGDVKGNAIDKFKKERQQKKVENKKCGSKLTK